ncbi:MAG TPA: pyruvate, phosphate dikinase [Solirubrobacterales bacterium]|nr:pyruvate, phosphate dikinase [Solirubrobacterales bacterium]
MDKWVYDFSEGSREMRELLGGKGANIAEMKRIGGPVRVPDGFTITTAACVAYMKSGGEVPDGLEEQVDEALARLEGQTGKRLGDPRDPLLVSVRSGARDSMPGMLDTVLNLGLNDESVRGLIGRTSNDRFGWDSYRRFVQMFGNVVRGIDGELFERAIKAKKEQAGATLDTDLDAPALEQLTGEFKQIFRAETGEEFPEEPREQLRQGILAIFESWNGARAVEYRRLNRIPDDWGTAVNVQQMVFGNTGDNSASGVAFSRDETTGAPEPSGDFLQNAQGEDVVAGVRNTQDLSELKSLFPELHGQLLDIMRTLERHYGDMQDVEFTIEDGTLYMLQTRSAKRPAQAAVRVAVDMVEEGLLTREEALLRIDAEKLDELLHPTFDPSYSYTPLARGVPASPGAAKGEIVFTASEAVQQNEGGRDVILVRPFTEAEDVAGFHAAKGIVTSEGGKASHAALVARGMGRPCVAGASALKIDLDSGTVNVNGTRLEAGDMIAIDGTRGVVTVEDVPLVAPELSDHFDTVLEWADEVRRLGVRANADTPADARRAREFGAAGIGLCRTEHMFMQADRQPKMRAMIMADTLEERRAALAELVPLQRADFEGIFEAMTGYPVTIRLLDPPLHEFLPSKSELLVERARLHRADDAGRIAELEHLLDRVKHLEEVNPMLGTRGCRLGIVHPEVYEMQVRAIVMAALAVRKRTGSQPDVEIMIPLVSYEQELEYVRELVERTTAQTIEDEGEEPLRVSVGTMIELPRACTIADLIANHADFFSFGTNDLTQTVLGFSRDDAEGGFLAHYLEQKIVPRSPFETLDPVGVGSLVRAAAAGGRISNPGLGLGICGEHGGDPDSIDFFDESGLDYVSCSPFRVPIARVAAAQAALRHRSS